MIPVPVVRATIQAKRISDGSLVTFRLAGGGDLVPYRFGGVPYAAGLGNIPKFQSAIGFDDNGWTGGVIPTTGKMGWSPSTSAAYGDAATLYLWKDAPLTLETGLEGPGGAEPGAWKTELVGTVADIDAQDGNINFTIADLSAKLATPLLTARFAGTGVLEGPTEAAGRIKRRSWGMVWNVEGRIIDKANSIWEFGDPAFPLQAFVEVRDIGRAPIIAPPVVAWQGSVAATFAALQAAAAPSGSCVVAPSIACVKWWTTPVGPLTADIQGEIGAGYVNLAPAIAERILQAANGPALAAGELAAANAIRPHECGFHVDDDSMTAANAMDKLLLGVSMLWILDPSGTVRLRPFTFTGPIETVKFEAAARQKIFAPQKTRRIGYKRNNRVQNDGEISAAIPRSRGDWAVSIAYYLNEIVQRNGASWQATVSHVSDNTNGPPGANWKAFAAEGLQGDPGTPGADGNWIDYRFKRQADKPAAPTVADPSDWSDDPPPGSGALWLTKAPKTFGGDLLGAWSDPQTISGLNPRGAYNATATYYPQDWVTYGGGSYVATVQTTGHAPTGTAQANTQWDVLAAPGAPGAPATPASAFTATITVPANNGLTNLRTLADAAGYTGASDATITFQVASGALCRGASGGVGIDTGTWPTGSYAISLALQVSGTVDGGGGAGGAGNGGVGSVGGDALFCQVNIAVTINSGGTIRAGGGGGGGGGKARINVGVSGEPDYQFYGGGGGGGGAPNGAGGDAGAAFGGEGSTGTAGTASGGGAGGAGSSSNGGGAGGGFGANGTAGVNSSFQAGGGGGAAGYAVRKNGYTVPVTNNGTVTGTAA